MFNLSLMLNGIYAALIEFLKIFTALICSLRKRVDNLLLQTESNRFHSLIFNLLVPSMGFLSTYPNNVL